MRVALYQPDIPGNAGAVMRTAACLGVGVDIIGPSGFAVSDRKLRRAGMDYLDQVDLVDHVSWEAYQDSLRDQPGRLVLLTTKAKGSYLQFTFRADDILLLGRESAGVPGEVHDVAEHAIKVPMVSCMRSLNIAQALAMVLGEALRQTEGFPEGKE